MTLQYTSAFPSRIHTCSVARSEEFRLCGGSGDGARCQTGSNAILFILSQTKQNTRLLTLPYTVSLSPTVSSSEKRVPRSAYMSESEDAEASEG